MWDNFSFLELSGYKHTKTKFIQKLTKKWVYFQCLRDLLASRGALYILTVHRHPHVTQQLTTTRKTQCNSHKLSERTHIPRRPCFTRPSSIIEITQILNLFWEFRRQPVLSYLISNAPCGNDDLQRTGTWITWMGLREARQYKTIQEPPVQSRAQLVAELLEQQRKPTTP